MMNYLIVSVTFSKSKFLILMLCLRIFQYSLRWMSPAALDLAEQLLAYDPLRRLSALQAMEAPYFTQEVPAAVLPEGYVQPHTVLFRKLISHTDL